ncbi:MAG: hypothetical protein JW836_15065 [Deltaproteobacteria bacterium]|nr:hypothetical protein [Deltaproteobacteria bacterium]
MKSLDLVEAWKKQSCVLLDVIRFLNSRKERKAQRTYLEIIGWSKGEERVSLLGCCSGVEASQPKKHGTVRVEVTSGKKRVTRDRHCPADSPHYQPCTM